MTATDVCVSPNEPIAEDAIRPYVVISVSVYRDQLASLDRVVAELKRAGYTKASRSLVLRACALRLPFGDVARLVAEQLGRDVG